MPNYYFLLTDIQKTLNAILGELKSLNEKPKIAETNLEDLNVIELTRSKEK